ncbi:RNA-binding domain-containing protein [Candidatus Poriferisocius sp.]|uniref:RNA-binding domain-containing protein n=1 Tax=Candidatus Poriferisocius sp. TaxID=3101276 RepID=UPI003B02B95C
MAEDLITLVATLVARGETHEIEFKRDVTDDELVEAVVCLTNGDGGWLLIGVDDNGNIVGVPPRHDGVTHVHRIVAMVANKTSPTITVEVSVAKLGGTEVVVVRVPKAPTVVATSSGRYLRRATDVHGKPECRPMYPHEVQARISTLGRHDLSELPLNGLQTEDLDPGELDRFRSLAGESGDAVLSNLSNGDLLSALGLLSSDNVPTLGAALIFGTQKVLEKFVPTHAVVFQALDAHYTVQANRNLRAPLMKAMLELVDAVQPYNPEEEIQDGLFRLDLPRYSEVTVRELIANALVHRNYSVNGQVRIAIEDTTLSVSSPGGFPDGITINNLLTAPPQARNPRIADAFKRAGLVERTGRGINRVYRSQLALGRPQPDYSRSTQEWVEVRVSGASADRKFAAFVAREARANRPLDLRKLQILHEVESERLITSTHAAQLLNILPAEARSVLNNLVEGGLLEARGEGRSRAYHLTAELYREVGEPVNYVRIRGFAPFQQEQMMLAYATEHGFITRSQAAELCRLSPDQASRLLRRMVEEGKLRMTGTRRTARYHPV